MLAISRDETQIAIQRKESSTRYLDIITLADMSRRNVREFADWNPETTMYWSMSSDFRYVIESVSRWGNDETVCESTMIEEATGATTVATCEMRLAKDARTYAYASTRRPKGLRESVPQEWSSRGLGLVTSPQIYVNSIGNTIPTLASIDTTPDPWPTFATHFSTSSDGRYVLFDSGDSLAVPDQTLPGPAIYDRRTGLTRKLPIPMQNARISPDGRYVLYTANVSDTSNLSLYDLFLYDLAGNTSRLVTRTLQGTPLNGHVSLGWFSRSGQYIFFETAVDNLVIGDRNSQTDVFRYAIDRSLIELVGIAPDGSSPGSATPSFSADGRHVAFMSGGRLLYRDMNTRESVLVSRSVNDPRPLNGSILGYQISGDGTRIVFGSNASNVVADDTNGLSDLFEYDVKRQQISLVTVNRLGASSAGESSWPSISDDGRFIAFISNSKDLTTNALRAPSNVYVRDLVRQKTIWIERFDDRSPRPRISGSGRFISYPIETLSPDWNKVPPPYYCGGVVEFDSTGKRGGLGIGGDECQLSDEEALFMFTEATTSPFRSESDMPGIYRTLRGITLDDHFHTRQFPESAPLDSGADTNDVDIADLNGDGRLDAFFTNASDGGHRVFLGNGAGNFNDSKQRLTGARAFYSELGDLDGDGDIDVFIPTLGADQVWFNDGSGRFTDSGQRLGNDRSIDVALGDLDADGDLDAYVANFEAQPDRVWINDGHGRFSDSGQLLGDTWSKGVELGDVDQDGDLDAIVANGPSRTTEPNRVWLNDGRGRFTDSGQRLGNAQTQHAALGDVDGDGDLDAVFANSYQFEEANEVWLNDGHGVFLDSQQRLGKESSSHVILTDFDQDGDLDLFVANWLGQASDVWLNEGDGIFHRTNDRLGVESGSHAAAGDFDRDGDMDVILANVDSAAVVYRNQFDPADIDPRPNQVREGAPFGTETGIRVSAKTTRVDPNYRLVDNAGGRFRIDAGTGVISVRDSTLLNASVNRRHRVSVQVNKDGGWVTRDLVIEVIPKDPEPEARDDLFTTNADTLLTVNSASGLLSNDLNPSRNPLRVASYDATSQQGATVSVADDGSFSFDPRATQFFRALTAQAVAEDFFTYSVTNGVGPGSSATAVVRVTGVNDPPVAADDLVNLLENAAWTDLTTILLGNDSDPDNGESPALAIHSIDASATRGDVEWSGGKLRYRPGADFDGTRIGEVASTTLEYTIRDPQGALSRGRVTINVTGEADQPGDFNGDTQFNVQDLAILCDAVKRNAYSPTLDLVKDGSINDQDLGYYLDRYLISTYGDVSMDGAFDSTDLVLVFQAGQYEDGVPGNSDWLTGDWNCDGEFTTSDLVRAFQSGRYGAGGTLQVRALPAGQCRQFGTYCDVQSALAAAGTGAAIVVWPGVYPPFQVDKDDMTIRASITEGGPVVIDAALAAQPGSTAVRVRGRGVSIQGLTAINARVGFLIEGDDGLFERNAAINNFHGFEVAGTGNRLLQNRAVASQEHGFVSVAAVRPGEPATPRANVYRENEATDNFGSGFNLAGDSEVVQGNTSARNGRGFTLLGPWASVIGNLASANRSEGFLSQYNSHRFQSNVARENLASGFVAKFSSNNLFMDNLSERNRGLGFELHSTNDSLFSNQANLNGQSGFFVAGSRSLITGNHATSNGGNGFELLGAGATLRDNRAIENLAWGFVVDSSTSVLLDNTSERNQAGAYRSP